VVIFIHLTSAKQFHRPSDITFLEALMLHLIPSIVLASEPTVGADEINHTPDRLSVIVSGAVDLFPVHVTRDELYSSAKQIAHANTPSEM
jgi:hypothetical protein